MRKLIPAFLFLCLAAQIFTSCAHSPNMPVEIDEPQEEQKPMSQQELNDALREAVYNKDVAAARSLLETGADANGMYNNSRKETFLMEAADRNDLQMVELLLDFGADMEPLNDYGRSVIYITDDQEILKLFASCGARFDIIDDEGRSPLMYHVQRNHTAEAVFLFDWEQKNSPRFYAGFNSRKDYYTAVFEQLFADNGYRNGSIEAKKDLIQRLLDAGVNAAARNAENIPIVNMAFVYLYDHYDYHDDFADGIIPLLIEHGAPINGFDKYDQTLLMRAAHRNPDGKLVDYLLQKGADPNQRNKAGETALMFARSGGAIETLIAAGVDPNAQDNEGRTALMKNLDWYSQRRLLQNGADPAIKDNEGRTVLYNWTWQYDLDLLDEFLARGCPLDDPDIYGITPMWHAAYNGNERRAINGGIVIVRVKGEIIHTQHEAIKALLERGADPNAQNNRGVSVLYCYLKSIPEKVEYTGWEFNGYLKEFKTAVSALLSAGARPGNMDKNGDSALTFVMREDRFSETKFKQIRNMVTKHAKADEKRIARAATADARKDRREYASYWFLEILPHTIFPLAVGGLSIGMREGAYASNPSANFMGTGNAILTMGMSGMILGVLINSGGSSGSEWSDMFSWLAPVAGGIVGVTVGLLSGIIMTAVNPQVGKTFNRNPVLYYLPTAISAFTATFTIFKVVL